MKRGFRIVSGLLFVTMLCGCNNKKVVEEQPQVPSVATEAPTVEEKPSKETEQVEQKETKVTEEPTPEVTKEPEVPEITPTTEPTPEVSEEPTKEQEYEHGALIEDQTFETELDGWGNITFASYLPKDENDDVTFLFLQTGEIVYCLEDGEHPYGFEQDKFVSVEAIAFKDCNEDGMKDIVAIIKYEKPDKTTYNTARIYLCHDISVEFQRDYEMEEYLAKQHATDSVKAVMDCIATYPEYQYSMLEPNIRKQFEIIADHADEWTNMIEEQFNGFFYTVTDLNHNGRLEVIATICEGSGFFSQNQFYEINETMDDLVVVEYPQKETGSEVDLTYNLVPVYHDPSTDTYRYIFNDLVRSGAMENCLSKEVVSIEDNKVVIDFLAGKDSYYESEDNYQIDCVDANGNKITETEFEQIDQKVFADFESGVATIDWKKFGSVDDFKSLDRKQLIKNLVDSHTAFETIWE